MKQKRRSFISILLSACMAITACGFTAFAAEPQQVDYYVNSDEGWTGSGYTMSDPSWGKIDFANYGASSGSYIFNKYDFQDDFSLVSRQTNVYVDKENPNPVHNILFCYRDSNNYYKFTYGGAPSTLSKVIDGEETPLESAEAIGAQTEVSIKVSHSADGTITASYGPKDGDGTGTDLFTVQDTSLTSGKFGFSSKGAGGYIANVTLSGMAVENSASTPPSTAPTPDDDNVNIKVNSFDDWSVTGYTISESKPGSNWWMINFSNYGDTSGSAIYNKYDFTDDFSFLTTQTSVYSDKNNASPVHNILFCYQDSNNYYKFTYGEAPSTLSKVIDGEEEQIAAGTKVGQENQVSLKITHSADGTITVTIGEKGGNGTGTDLLTAKDTSLTSGKIGMTSTKSAGFIADVTLSGKASENSSVVTPPAETEEPDDDTISYKVVSLDDWTVTGKYTITESNPGSNWWQVNFSNYGDTSGSAIYNKYDFSEDFSILTTNTSVYTNTDASYPNPVHNILFCYQNENNYYKLTYGATATTLSKVINGIETILDEGDTIGNNTQIALKITYTDGNISASFGTSGSAGTDTELVSANDTSLTYGKIGFSSSGAGGHIADITLSGKASENSSVVTPPPAETEEPDDDTISYDVTSSDDWSGSGYSMGTWNNIEFSNYGDNSGTIIFDKYYFVDTFSVLTTQTNVYEGSHNILFCYQDSNNYYKLTYGAGATTLSKVTNGNETEIASGESIGSSTEASLIISRGADGTITVNKGDAGSYGPNINLITAKDTSFSSGKIGLSSKGAGGYIANLRLSGKISEEPPAVTPPPADDTINYDVRSDEGWIGSGYEMKDASWGQIYFKTSGTAGSYIFDTYNFKEDFSFMTDQANIYTGMNNILFCYQDNNNYYKLSVGASSTTLSKVIGGAETELATGASIGTGVEFSLKLTHSADGTITVTKGDKGAQGVGTTLLTAADNTLSYGKIGLSSIDAEGYIALINISGKTGIPEGGETPPPSPSVPQVDENVTYNVRSDEGWVGSGYEMKAPSWGQITFDSLGTVGSYILETYDFADNMSFMTAQTNIYSGSNNILFCYQDNNNYYKLSYNKDSAVLSKLINGVEYVLSESSSAVSADDEFSLKVSRNINGTITVTSGTKAGDGTGNFILSARDSSLTHGMMGMSSSNSQGYAALITVSGSTAEPSETLTISNVDKGADSITVDYTAADIDSSSIIAAVLYDASGRMAAMGITDISADGSISVPTSGLSGKYTVVLFNWDSLSQLNPLAAAAAKAGIEL